MVVYVDGGIRRLGRRRALTHGIRQFAFFLLKRCYFVRFHNPLQ
jgi:hypothetical protein